MSTFKPCPFCGGREIRPSPYLNWSFCVGCRAAAPRDANVWNTRAPVEETPEEYRARIVEEACEALAICASTDGEYLIRGVLVDSRSDTSELAMSAFAHSDPERKSENNYAEAEAMLRCGWRPDWWPKEGDAQ